ncbi:hypothetical protein TSAR_013024 [Trichomalopsis sarcophagae]|uniref:Uncharacterized protein n=1 Tax=Trichomalopsis sarcophagae TaxID=543379 RepID=A0A232FBT7_9HYME|nr:hypothetical protein TSAR_013024 [Trichomalopsis sarcophagae]
MLRESKRERRCLFLFLSRDTYARDRDVSFSSSRNRRVLSFCVWFHQCFLVCVSLYIHAYVARRKDEEIA